MRILLVEDNIQIATNIAEYLKLEDIQVDVATDGEQGREWSQTHRYDVMVLDWMLPKLSGVDLCARIRKTSDVPVIILTARWEIDDKLTGFECGADDYLVKPFDLAELVARIQALYRRSATSDEFIYDDISVTLKNRTITKAWVEVNLTIKEFYILEYLIKNRGTPVSRADLVDYVRWGDAIWENTDKLDVYIANLRKKLHKELIETIKGFGYKIER